MFPVSLAQLPTHLFRPRRFQTSGGDSPIPSSVSVVIPAYKPPRVLFELVTSLIRIPSVHRVIIVDDATPKEDSSARVFSDLRELSLDRIVILHNERNLMSAGSVNQGLRYERTLGDPPNYILVVNDDTLFENDTLHELVRKIESNPHLGAVCAQVRVANARKNLLTRFQRLEYRMFNVVRKADEGFLYGPLIMPGMTVLFRREVLFQTGGYDPSCIIEDYDMTVRVKQQHWHVAMAERARASTFVPETWGTFWKQRVRWYYGGLTVVRRHWRSAPAVFSDVLSHFLNIALVGLVIASVIWTQPQSSVEHSYFTFRGTLLTLAILGILIEWAYLFWIDRGKDWIDVLIAVLIIPELYYRTLNTLIVFGCYVFYVYKLLSKKLDEMGWWGRGFVRFGDKAFAKIGFTAGWGTK